jgi:hypothetical protein
MRLRRASLMARPGRVAIRPSAIHPVQRPRRRDLYDTVLAFAVARRRPDVLSNGA